MSRVKANRSIQRSIRTHSSLSVSASLTFSWNVRLADYCRSKGGGEGGGAQTGRHATARMESRQLHARKEREGRERGGRAADHRAEERTADDQHWSVWITHKLPEWMRELEVRRLISYQQEMSTCVCVRVCEEGVGGGGINQVRCW